MIMIKRIFVVVLTLFIAFCVSKAVAFQRDSAHKDTETKIDIQPFLYPKSDAANHTVEKRSENSEQQQANDQANEQSEETTQATQASGTADVQNLKLVNLEGRTFKLSDFKGKTVLLNYFGSWCAPCKQEIPALVDYFNNNPRKDVVVLLIDASYYELSVNDVKAFKSKYNVPFEILLDKDKAIKNELVITTIPTTMVINKKGKLTETHVGPVNKAWLTQRFNE